jgi:hypothetical protein
MEILANYYPDLVGFHGNNVHDLLNDIMPNQFGIASEERHVNFVVNIADMVLVSVFLCLDTDFLVVAETAGAVFLDGVQHLAILSHAGRAVKYEIG